MSSDHISVCVCTYKRPTLLSNLLRALQKQETQALFSYSVVVVDNDKNKSARDTVQSIKDESTVEIEYYVEPRQNISHARNLSVEKAKGSLIAFIDDDELPTRDWLLHLYKTQAKFNADGVLGAVLPRFEQEPPSWITKSKIYYWTQEGPVTGTVMTTGQTGNALIKRSLVGPDTMFNPDFGLSGGEDTEFFEKLIDKGYVFVSCREGLVHDVIPPRRWQTGYLVKRKILQGVTTVRRFRSMNKSLLFRLKWFGKAVAAIVIYALLLFVRAPFGKGPLFKCIMQIAYFAGVLTEYAHVSIIKDRSQVESQST